MQRHTQLQSRVTSPSGASTVVNETVTESAAASHSRQSINPANRRWKIYSLEPSLRVGYSQDPHQRAQAEVYTSARMSTISHDLISSCMLQGCLYRPVLEIRPECVGDPSLICTDLHQIPWVEVRLTSTAYNVRQNKCLQATAMASSSHSLPLSVEC